MSELNSTFEFLQKLEEVSTKFYELNEKYTLDEDNNFRQYYTDTIEDQFGLTKKASNDPARSYSAYSKREYSDLILAIKHEGNSDRTWIQTKIAEIKQFSNEEITDDIAWLKQTYDELSNLYPYSVGYLKTLDVILGLDEEYYESSRCW